MYLKTLTVLAILSVVGTTAQASDFSLIGVGQQSCAEWISARQQEGDPESYQQQSWVLGFLSGIGSADLKGVDPLNGMNATAVAGWIDFYCHSHPQERIANAAIAFVRAHPQ